MYYFVQFERPICNVTGAGPVSTGATSPDRGPLDPVRTGTPPWDRDRVGSPWSQDRRVLGGPVPGTSLTAPVQGERFERYPLQHVGLVPTSRDPARSGLSSTGVRADAS